MDYTKGKIETIENQNFIFSTKDKKNKLNKSDIEVSIDLLNEIENGISIESLEATNLPVFSYQTQITIHGKFPSNLSTNRVGGYKNLIENQNGSIGIKYNAIDFQKKNDIIKACRYYKDSQWKSNLDSKGFSIVKLFKSTTKADCILQYINFKKEMEDFPKDSFIGQSNVNCFYNSFFGLYIAMIEIHISAIYTIKEDGLYNFLFNDSKENVFKYVNMEIEREKEEYRKKTEDYRKEVELQNKMKLDRAKQEYEEYTNKYKVVNKLTFGLNVYFSTKEYKKFTFFVGKKGLYKLPNINSYSDKNKIAKNFKLLNISENLEYNFIEFVLKYEEIGAKELAKEIDVSTLAISNFIKNNITITDEQKVKTIIEKNGVFNIK